MSSVIAFLTQKFGFSVPAGRVHVPSMTRVYASVVWPLGSCAFGVEESDFDVGLEGSLLQAARTNVNPQIPNERAPRIIIVFSFTTGA